MSKSNPNVYIIDNTAIAPQLITKWRNRALSPIFIKGGK